MNHNRSYEGLVTTSMKKLVVNTDESFEHLPHAPIVEAVIDIRARSSVMLEETVLKPQLEAKLSDYQFLDSQQQIQIKHDLSFQENVAPSAIIRNLGWKGLRFQSADKNYIAQFNRDGFVFSRLEPYQSWEQLYDEGLRLWRVYVELAQPVEFHRIGLRYINRIQLPPDVVQFEDYIEPAPVPPKNLSMPFHSFMHQDTLAVRCNLQIQIKHDLSFQENVAPSAIIRNLGWKGLRFQSADKNYIAQFNRDGFVFSRLEPYQSWEQLYDEGLRLWRVYVELAQPVEFHRIGLRYINRIQLPPDVVQFEDYMEPAPVPPKNLSMPFHGFMHQDTLAVPEHPYAINVIRTIQPPPIQGIQGLSLILDIDAFTTQEFELDEAALERRLLEMRWLKNKVFFGSVTPKTLKLFR